MDEKEIRLDEVNRFQTFLSSHGVINAVLLGYADDRRRALDVEFAPAEVPVAVEVEPEAEQEQSAS